MRTAAEDREVTTLLRVYDRTVARLTELGIDVSKARPAREQPRPCGCRDVCGDDGDTEGDGVCKGLRLPPRRPPVEIVLVDR